MNDDRSQFEAWAKPRGYAVVRTKEGYREEMANIAWEAWQAARAWRPIEDDVPSIGQIVLLYVNGVVQNELYIFDETDDGAFTGQYCWARDDLDELIPVRPGQKWQPLPPGPQS